MSLRGEASELSTALNLILEALLSRGSDGWSPYATEAARKLAPAIRAYDRAVFETRSRQAASEALGDLADSLSDLSAAATKGEMPLSAAASLNKYWKLYTIFRESKYRNDSL